MKSCYLSRMLAGDKHYRNAFLLAAAVPLVGAAAAAVILIWWDTLVPLFPACHIKRLTGYNCLSCGATRSTLALLRCDIVTAVWYNPLYVLFLCWMAYFYVRVVISLFVRPYRHFAPKISNRQIFAAVAAAIIFTVIRNLPFYQTIFF